MSQLLSKPTPAEPWYCRSTNQVSVIWYWKPPDQFMMVGILMLGSYQDAERPE